MRQAALLTLRVLTFRATREELDTLDWKYLPFGLLCTWIVGMGRWWDDPRANWAQHLGLGSLAYVFVLAFVLWVFLLPLRPRRNSYGSVLAFVTATAAPALLYAIPIERWTDLATARKVNVWFLGVVACWRVALYLFYAVRSVGLRWWLAVIGALLPIALSVFLLTVANLERAVFDVMSGLRADGTPHDEAYQVLFLVSALSFYAAPVLLLLYVLAIRQRR